MDYKALEKSMGGIPDTTQIDILIALCELTKLPHKVVEHMGRPAVCFPDSISSISDAVCHYGSYGHQQGLIEIMGLVQADTGDSVEGWLTAAEVFCRWYTYWKKELRPVGLTKS